jgi:hypothetical protein
MSFKLIAIRPLVGCNRKFLKNLEENRIYQFYNDYKYLDDRNELISKFDKNNQTEVSSIKYSPTIPENFFGNENLNINISAIVGKNGSGKSALTELLYSFIYYLSRYVDLINDKSISDDEYLIPFEKARYIKELEDFKKLNIEVFYEYKDVVCKIKLFDEEFSKIIYTNSNNDFNYTNESYNNNNSSIKKQFIKDSFFYSIVINYSLYALNTNIMGVYLKTIFHKNDGYQTPIVLNPMRTDGKIDVNREYYLSKSRLLASLLMPIENNGINELREVAKGKIISEIKLVIEKSKFKYDDQTNKLKTEFTDWHLKKKWLDEIFTALKFDKPFAKDDLNNEIYKHAIEYILRKIDRIADHYSNYKCLFKINYKNSTYDEREEYFRKLVIDDSHVTFKLCQAVNFLKNNRIITTEKLDVFFDIDDLVKEINKDFNKPITYKIEDEEFKSKGKVAKNYIDIIDLIPPSFFKIDFKFKNNKATFNELSSGECQKIYSLYSIIYHILNLVSIYKSNDVGHKYNRINIIFDEIELYFHPEMQKTFINDLLNLIKKSVFANCQLNFVFITHSPFILSDIPNQNIMYLKEGNTLVGNDRPQKSFGANITDLLADSFFYGNDDKSLIGDFAHQKIKETITWLNDQQAEKVDKLKKGEAYNPSKNEYEKHEQIINIIDEPIIKIKLTEMLYHLKSGTDFEIKLKEIQLEELAKELKYKIEKQ